MKLAVLPVLRNDLKAGSDEFSIDKLFRRKAADFVGCIRSDSIAENRQSSFVDASRSTHVDDGTTLTHEMAAECDEDEMSSGKPQLIEKPPKQLVVTERSISPAPASVPNPDHFVSVDLASVKAFTAMCVRNEGFLKQYRMVDGTCLVCAHSLIVTGWTLSAVYVFLVRARTRFVERNDATFFAAVWLALAWLEDTQAGQV